MLTVTVSQLNRYIKAVMEEDKKLSGIIVRGEISGFVRHYQSGHCYFSLKDKAANLRAVMFKEQAARMRFAPENGMEVLAQGNVSVFERDGAYQLYVTDLLPAGAGAAAVALEQLRAKLTAEGLFDAARKKSLPAYPAIVGVITSKSGAAISDITSVISRRYPLCKLLFHPALVQGEKAAQSLAKAVVRLDDLGCDVIILARGGGSDEDLSAFNDEGLARAVAAAKTPVISAVGHETDYSLCDWAADVRAATPSAAAELATPSTEKLREQLTAAESALAKSARRLLGRSSELLELRKNQSCLKNPMQYVGIRSRRLDFLRQKLYNEKDTIVEAYEHRLSRLAGRLDALSPLRVLGRGYCIARRGEKPITKALQLVKGESITLRFSDAGAVAQILEVEKHSK